MAKRKVQDAFADDISPSKRTTRSANTLKVVQPSVEVSTPTRRQRGGQAEVATPRVPPPKRVYGRNTRALDSSSHKENENTDEGDIDGSDADELNIGPENKELEDDAAGAKGTKRVVFDAVVISTPTKPKRTYQTRLKAQPTSVPALRLPDFGPAQKSPTKKQINQDPVASSRVELHRDEGRSLATKSAESRAVRVPVPLPSYLLPCLNAQKRAILDALLDPPLEGQGQAEDDEPAANVIALQQLTSLLSGSIRRGEGNSCLLIGPAGSGKTKIFEKSLLEFTDEKPIVVRLNGHVQRTDRLAMREIARQIVEQTGNEKFSSLTSDSAENPFLDEGDSEAEGFSSTLPPSAHLPSLISALPTLARPVVVLLDYFDLFTHHPRQALLYCLLDTVQSCRAGSDSQRGLAVVGLTSRVDVMNLLEKRVKSRFSHRTFRTATLRKVNEWIGLLHDCLSVTPDVDSSSLEHSAIKEWQEIWSRTVESFVEERTLKDLLQDMFGVTRDLRILQRVMADAISNLSVGSPYLSVKHLRSHVKAQRSVPRTEVLSKLNYPSLSLLIAAEHMRTAGHDTFTFEMLRDAFQNQVRTSSAAPVMIAGGGIGMMSIGRGILMGAFEQLVRKKIFLPASSATSGSGKEFIRHRSLVMREDVKRAVDAVGQTSLRKWFHKAQ